MKKERLLISMLGTFVLISIVGCGSSSQPVGADIIQKYNFHIKGQPTAMSITLPQQLSGANWDIVQSLCQHAGYDLRPYAGQGITSIKYSLAERLNFHSDSLSLIVLAQDQACICAYIAASNLIPGLIAINDPNVNMPPSVKITLTDANSTVSILKGQILAVSLWGNGSTGYVWEVLPGPEPLLEQRGWQEFKPDNPDPGAVGGGGTYTFMLKAAASGTAPLKLVYRRPWDAGVEPQQTFEVTVVIDG